MSFIVQLTTTASKQYKHINNPFRNNIAEKIDLLAAKGLKLSNIKALKGNYSGLYRLRVGNYRIIFDIEKNIITIISILHRKDSY